MLGQIVIATKGHAMAMAPRMRAIEIQEVMDSIGLTPALALLYELERSTIAWSWIVDGQIACMFGIVSTLGAADAYPWFLTTPMVEQHSRQFARTCKTLLPELLAVHPKLVGMVDARHVLSVRWLQWLGATLGDPQPWGVAGAPFRHFEIGA